jgi:hypothetical protein
MDFWGSFLVIDQKFSLLYIVKTISGAHPAFYKMGIKGYFPRCKVSGACN